MNRKGYIFLVLVAVVLIFGMHEAYAGSNNPEDRMFNILERVLSIISDFMDRIFQSIADAVRSVFSDGDSSRQSAGSSSLIEEGRQVLDFYKS